MSYNLMDGYPSPRATLCVLAGVGALTGGVAGAAIVGKLATDGSGRAAVAQAEPAVASSTRAAQVAAVAAQSPSRLPTPWSAADAKAAGERHRAEREQAPPQAPMRLARTGAAPADTPASNGATRVTKTGASPAPATTAPRASAPVRSPAQTPARSPIAPPARAPVRSPAPVRTPEPAPQVARPSPEQAPARPAPKPDPTGAFDDSG